MYEIVTVKKLKCYHRTPTEPTDLIHQGYFYRFTPALEGSLLHTLIVNHKATLIFAGNEDCIELLPIGQTVTVWNIQPPLSNEPNDRPWVIFVGVVDPERLRLACRKLP